MSQITLLALVWMHPERDLKCLALLAGVAAFLFARLFKSRIAGVVFGFVATQLAALALHWLHFFGTGLDAVWLLPGLLVPLVAALCGALLARVPWSPATKAT